MKLHFDKLFFSTTIEFKRLELEKIVVSILLIYFPLEDASRFLSILWSGLVHFGFSPKD
jgi:hypothetical protein